MFTPTVDEELTMIGPPCLLPKNTKNSLTEKELKTTLHALDSISYFNVRGTYTGEDIQTWKTNYADITQGIQKNPHDRSVFDLTIVTKQLSDSAGDTRWVLRAYLHNVRRTHSGRSPKGDIECPRLTSRPSTLKMMSTSTAPNAIIYKGELERSTTGITRVLLDVLWSSCSLSNILASHSSLALSRI